MGAGQRISSGGRRPARSTGSRRRQSRALAVAAVAALTVGLAACGGHHRATTAAGRPPSPSTTVTVPTTTAVPSTTTTVAPPKATTTTTVAPRATPQVTVSPVAAEQAAFRRLVLTLPAHAYATSAIYRTGTLVYAIVARDVTPLSSEIDVDIYRNGSFTPIVGGIGSNQNLDLVALSTIQAGDITGSTYPDFLVLLAAGGHVNGVVLSFAGGSWHLLGNEDRTGAAASVELVRPQLVRNGVTQAVDDCNPTCATGTYSVTTYVFDPPTGELAAAGPPSQQSQP